MTVAEFLRTNERRGGKVYTDGINLSCRRRNGMRS